MVKVLKDDLGCFCHCEDCTTEKDTSDCKDILESDGLVQATDENGCGFIQK